MARKSKNINLKKRILILCEGESEQIYLQGLKKDKFSRGLSIDIEMYQPKDYSPLGIVNEAKKKTKKEHSAYPYLAVWVVFDKDSHANIPSAFDLAFSNKKTINIAFSNICFEYWVLLHFEKKNKYFNNSKSIIDYIKNNHGLDYEKTMNIYDAISDKIEIALGNVDWLNRQNANEIENGMKPYDLSAYTDFDKLYLYLIDAFNDSN